jgi:hypothetical protein
VSIRTDARPFAAARGSSGGNLRGDRIVVEALERERFLPEVEVAEGCRLFD